MHVIHLIALLYHYFLSNQNIKKINITYALLGLLQKFTITILFATGIFLWFTENENREKKPLSQIKISSSLFYMLFIEHKFSSTIIYAINNVDSSKFFLIQNKLIMIKISFKSSTIHKINAKFVNINRH